MHKQHLRQGRLLVEELKQRQQALADALQPAILGDGPAREWIEERLPAAIYTGFQGGADLSRAYASMDIFFNPSSTETFGNVTLEAMACGLPVVAARATGSMGLVEDGVSGLFATPDSAAESADALQRLIEDSVFRASAGAAGLARAAKFDWDAVNQVVLDRYQAVLGEQHRLAAE